jgi:hypothetical protein
MNNSDINYVSIIKTVFDKFRAKHLKKYNCHLPYPYYKKGMFDFYRECSGNKYVYKFQLDEKIELIMNYYNPTNPDVKLNVEDKGFTEYYKHEEFWEESSINPYLNEKSIETILNIFKEAIPESIKLYDEYIEEKEKEEALIKSKEEKTKDFLSETLKKI